MPVSVWRKTITVPSVSLYDQLIAPLPKQLVSDSLSRAQVIAAWNFSSPLQEGERWRQIKLLLMGIHDKNLCWRSLALQIVKFCRIKITCPLSMLNRKCFQRLTLIGISPDLPQKCTNMWQCEQQRWKHLHPSVLHLEFLTPVTFLYP